MFFALPQTDSFEDSHGSRLYGAAGPELPEHPFTRTRRQKWVSFLIKLTLVAGWIHLKNSSQLDNLLFPWIKVKNI